VKNIARKLIGILTSKAKKLPIRREADRLGVDVLVFGPKGIFWKKRRIRGYLYSKGHWKKKRFCHLPSAIYNRKYTHRADLANKLENLIGRPTVFNSVTWFDKWRIYELLRSAKLVQYLPETGRYSPSTVANMLSQWQKLIVKPSRGSFGKDIYLMAREESSFNLYHNLQIPKISQPTLKKFITSVDHLFNAKPFIVQQFISMSRFHDKIFDIRIYVQKNGRGRWSVPGGFCRLAVGGSYITNQSIDLVGIEEMTKYRLFSRRQFDRMRHLSVIVAKVIEAGLGHLGEMGVDFCIDMEGRLWIIEVNGHTQKSLLKRVNDKSVKKAYYFNPLAYAQHLAR